MPDFYDVAMFQAAAQKNKNLLPKPNEKSDSRGQPAKKDAMASEVTLVNGDNGSQSQPKDTEDHHRK
ncbi:hypothetical protein SLS53_006194 [Cytospora paraplurivora]|uniref:Uncharacterized protein n=1 Tax=Cytospora paraplurivora TaxID=2898453 RepID=A0AAN9U5I3_9PEZI